MADSIINICNRTLSQIAETNPISSFQDGTVESQQCGLWYDTQRQRILRAAPWGFARTQTQTGLTQLADLIPDNTGTFPFLFSYAYPSDCLKFRYILPPWTVPNSGPNPPLTGVGFVPPNFRWGPSRKNRFVIHNWKDGNGNTQKVILSNVPNALGVYTKDEQDPDIFDVLFTDALEQALAFKLCIPISGNIAMQGNFKAAAEQALTSARAIDGNEAIPFNDPKVDWIEARGSGYGWRDEGPAGGGGGLAWGNWYDGWEEMNWSM